MTTCQVFAPVGICIADFGVLTSILRKSKEVVMKNWETLKKLLKDIKTLAESKGESGIELLASNALFVACELEPVKKERK